MQIHIHHYIWLPSTNVERCQDALYIETAPEMTERGVQAGKQPQLPVIVISNTRICCPIIRSMMTIPSIEAR
jgi:hypothetical protein